MTRLICFLASTFLLGLPIATADQPDEQEQAREQRLVEYLSGAKLTGRYTTDGGSEGTKPETYVISKAEKLAERNRYRLHSRIQYGGKDVEVPIDLYIFWAGNTPVITMDNLGIPGMGTFSARVLFHNDRYVGTWVHDEKGGHLFGQVTKD